MEYGEMEIEIVSLFSSSSFFFFCLSWDYVLIVLKPNSLGLGKGMSVSTIITIKWCVS